LAKNSKLILANDSRVAVIFKALCEDRTYPEIAKDLGLTIDQIRLVVERLNLKNRADIAKRQALDIMQNDLTHQIAFKQIETMSLLQPKLLKLSQRVDDILQAEGIEDEDAIKSFCRLLELHAKLTGADKSSEKDVNVNIVYQKVMEAADKMKIDVRNGDEVEEIELIE
jgi:hypothetical protein